MFKNGEKSGNKDIMLIGTYYIQLKDAHINWGKHRKTNTRKLRGEEAYIAIPAEYAYAYNIKKGNVYVCCLEDNKKIELKASGTQSRRDYAKQFEGNRNLKIVYDWYKRYEAKEGDYVVVAIYDNNVIDLEFISASNHKRLKALNIYGKKGKVSDLEKREDVGFRLVSIQIKNKDIEHINVRFFPDDLKSKSTEPITTVIVGANGAGKSFILMMLSDIFNAVKNVSSIAQLKYSYYGLKYILKGDLIEIEIVNRTIIIHKNDVLLGVNDFALPEKVLAVSFMLNDKFHFKPGNSTDEKSIYEYLGVRMTSNASWTSSIGNKVAECLINLASDGRLQYFIDSLSKYLSLENRISIGCEVLSGDFFMIDIKEHLIKAALKIIEQDEFRSNSVKKIAEEEYNLLAEFIQGIKKNKLYREDGNRIIFGIDFSSDTTKEEIERIKNDYNSIKNLCNLKVIKSLSLYLCKNGKRYSFDDASSGEKHILYSFANIFNSIKKNSLILIDEPEISLHPNWQIKYIDFLKNVFKDYNSCHFVIATHSHFLVSDLNPESSSLITIETDEKNNKIINTIDYSTYAWSAENILYNVFSMRTTRNYYFDLDIRKLLYLISHQKREEILQIKSLYNKLNRYVLDESDPLIYILNEAKGYIDDVESRSY